FRIDLGIRHPDYPERFLAGVECDGARYHASKSARDRDRLREEVLCGLGWDLVRVWSTDWFDNPARETDKLVKRLEELRSKSHAAYEDYPSFASAFQAQGVRSPEVQSPELGREDGHEPEVPEVVSAVDEPSLLDPGPASVPELSLLHNDSPLTKAQ